MDPAVIFKATYSGIPVFEMPCKGVAMMKRRADSWLNATQILKVAGFDKPQRTKILERQVQKGTHEKIQGGYGKYQGTWVPFERGVGLCREFGVYHLLAPLLDFQVSPNNSPPQAPKHVIAPPKVRVKKVAASRAHALATNKTKPGGRNTNNSCSNFDSDSEANLSLNFPLGNERSWPAQSKHVKSSLNRSVTDPLAPPPSDYSHSTRLIVNLPSDPDQSLSPTPSDIGSSSRVPSPTQDLIVPYPNGDKGKGREASSYDVVEPSARGDRKRKHYEDAMAEDFEAPADQYDDEDNSASAKYARLILDYFVSESCQIPDFLINPPHDFDPNVTIDDDGHTALHWACAMGRLRIVKLLMSCGADIFRANHAGQTALMRAVMFTNNYELRKFPELFESFHRSTINIDRTDRTVFHYVIDIALQKGKLRAARYYLETILNRLSEYPKELADILNFQDENGETALTLAAKCRSKRLIKMLLEHGADPKIANQEGKSTEDYIMEDEKFRALSPTPYPAQPLGLCQSSSSTRSSNPSAIVDVTDRPTTASIQHTPAIAPDPPHLAYSETGHKIASQAIPEVKSMFESLAGSFDDELQEKERDLEQANSLLKSIQGELAEGSKKLAHYESLLSDFPEKKSNLAELELGLNLKMNKRYRYGWEKYVRDEEEREASFKEQQQVLKESLLAATNTASQSSREELLAKLRQLEEDHCDLEEILQTPTDVREECEQARKNIGELREQRVELFDELIKLASDSSPSKNLSTEVDEVIDSLNDGLEVPLADCVPVAKDDGSTPHSQQTAPTQASQT